MTRIANFFKPQGVAIIGASSNPQKLSHGILKNMLSYGYQGKIYPVNPKSETILDLPCYASISDVPDPVDLAVIILPSKFMPAVIEDCGKRRIKSAIIISGGFKEVGEEGKQLEARVLDIAQQYEMRLIGPNCVGTIDLHSGLNSTFINGLPDKGGVAFISQSGAVCGAAVDYLLDKGVGFSHFISLGNEADVTETNMIEYLAEDDNVNTIVIYAESIKNGTRFIEAARNTTAKKPIIILKSGRSEAGARAVSSHTGSLAGSLSAYQAAFKQAGVQQVENIQELYAFATGFSSQPLPKGNCIAIVTNAGGGAALTSDALDRFGLELANFNAETINNMQSAMNPAAQLSNPVDMLGGASPMEYKVALENILADPNVDAVIPIIVPTALVNPLDVAKVWVEAANSTDKPVICCLMGEASLADGMDYMHQHQVPVFTFPEQCATTLGAMYSYAKSLQDRNNQSPYHAPINKQVTAYLSEQKKDTLGEHETRTILDAYNLPLIPGGFAKDSDEAIEIANKIGYPVAMKIVSPQILHKSDAGGIMLGIADDEALRSAVVAMRQAVTANVPEAKIEGFLIEKMAPKGMEVIVGMKRDPNFGPLVMFGMGGIFVELFKDIAFGVAPLTESDVNHMIAETKAGTLLNGYRGSERLDVESLKKTILCLSAIAINHPEIVEIEINPLLVLPEGQGTLALDARAILEK